MASVDFEKQNILIDSWQLFFSNMAKTRNKDTSFFLINVALLHMQAFLKVVSLYELAF